MKKPILVVMAAGMGSRYGGLKQIDPVGCEGEAILDYSLFDAHEAGFDTAVIIIKEAIKKDFMETVGARLQKAPMEIRYAYQELEKLPTSYTVPEGRTKPWGTCHAVVCAREAIGDAPFAVINADDYYGKAAFKEIYNYLSAHADDDKYRYCMVGYELGKTVTDNGSVARGVCQVNGEGFLESVVERTKIEKQADGVIRFTEDGSTSQQIKKNLKQSDLRQETEGTEQKGYKAYAEPVASAAFAADPIILHMTKEQLEKSIAETTRLMKAAAKELDFLQAAQYRDEIIRLQKELELK